MFQGCCPGPAASFAAPLSLRLQGGRKYKDPELRQKEPSGAAGREKGLLNAVKVSLSPLPGD